MGRGARQPGDYDGERVSPRPRPSERGGPFAPPEVPPASPKPEPVEVLRLGVLLQRLDASDYGAKVVRRRGDSKTGPLKTIAAARATDPVAALTGATAAAVEALRAELEGFQG